MRKALIAVCAVAALVATAPIAVAQTLDDVLSRYRAAKGGENWEKLESMRMTARIVTQGIELPMTMVTKRPNLMRQDMSFQGISMVQAYDGTTAWGINPMMGSEEPTELTGPMADAMREQADFDGGLFNYAAKGSKVDLVGTEDLDGAKVIHIKLTTRDNQVQHYYLDAETMLEKRLVIETDMGGGPMTVETRLSNYQTVDGFSVPMSITQIVAGNQVALTVEKVEFNVHVDDAYFRMPGK